MGRFLRLLLTLDPWFLTHDPWFWIRGSWLMDSWFLTPDSLILDTWTPDSWSFLVLFHLFNTSDNLCLLFNGWIRLRGEDLEVVLCTSQMNLSFLNEWTRLMCSSSIEPSHFLNCLELLHLTCGEFAFTLAPSFFNTYDNLCLLFLIDGRGNKLPGSHLSAVSKIT